MKKALPKDENFQL